MTTASEARPGRSQPPAPRTGPTPEDPREHEPMRDPPIYPEHDDEVRQADGASGVEVPDPSPDDVIYDSPVE
jgi:hypothetical protein